MSVLKILKYPDPLLRETSRPVTVFDARLRRLASDMTDTMLDAPGAGLAAPQVGELQRLIVIDDRDDSEEEEYGSKNLALVNPVIVRGEGSREEKEGCLSVEDLKALVERFDLVEVEYQDLAGEPRRLTAGGHKAVIVQHEIDHLNGILFLDHLSPLTRELYLKSLKKKKRRGSL
ncbi:MAG: peptide deformylase [Deltaproteobacteria bacterium]|jgi:peptide deformylase|nr:peptide deformylase [Deltaproteobacteria bacterium]